MELQPFDEWAELVSMAIYATAKEGGGRILLHKGGEGCANTLGGSCPCGPELLVVEKNGTVR